MESLFDFLVYRLKKTRIDVLQTTNYKKNKMLIEFVQNSLCCGFVELISSSAENVFSFLWSLILQDKE